ncbi:hypothetical protein HYV71_04375 [Candidatus Uhrbacteria bacterium]|nr:hypothetical protein [Candidatus Uhrbacteria bacterium]
MIHRVSTALNYALPTATVALVIATLFTVGFAAQAGPLDTQLNHAKNAIFGEGNEPYSLPVVVALIIQFNLGALGMIVTIRMVMAGFAWMSAAGDEKKLKDAQQTIKNSLIGLIIVIAAYAITNFALNAFIKATVGT